MITCANHGIVVITGSVYNEVQDPQMGYICYIWKKKKITKNDTEKLSIISA